MAELRLEFLTEIIWRDTMRHHNTQNLASFFQGITRKGVVILIISLSFSGVLAFPVYNLPTAALSDGALLLASAMDSALEEDRAGQNHVTTSVTQRDLPKFETPAWLTSIGPRSVFAASFTTVDFAIIQFPTSINPTVTGDPNMIFGQVFEPGVTESAGSTGAITGQLGFGPLGTDPSVFPQSWVWVSAPYNVAFSGPSNNDEHVGTIFAPSVGPWNYTFRFSMDGGTTWTYADVDGSPPFNANNLGTMTVVAGAPSVQTTPASNLTTTGSRLNGNARPRGASTTGYFRYGTTNPGTCNDSFGTRAPVSGGTPLLSGASAVSYDEDVTGLVTGTTYYYCAIAVNSAGTSFGSVQQFTPALQPAIMITGGPLNFGNQNVGTTSTAQTLMITNTGAADLVLGTPLLTNGTQFAVSNVPSSPIPNAESVLLSFTFSPTSVGSKTDTVTIVSNVIGPAPTVELSGTGTAPGVFSLNASSASVTEGDGTVQVTVNRSSGSSGAVSVSHALGAAFNANGAASCAANIDFVNTGATLNFADGETSKQVDIQICDDAVPEGGLETFQISLQNATNGSSIGSPSSATVTIVDNDIPLEINITNGNFSIPDGWPVPEDFGTTGTTFGTITRRWHIQNQGTSVLNLTGTPVIEITGQHASDFTVTLLPTSPILLGIDVPFEITFDPSDAGTRTASVSIANNDSDEGLYNFDLRGEAITAPAPTLGTYVDSGIPLSGNATITPSATPTDTNSITVSAPPELIGKITADSPGLVRITNAQPAKLPAGVYPVTLRATGYGGVTTTAFNLTINPAACGGTSGFANGTDIANSGVQGGLVIGDFDNDGDQDVATLTIHNQVSVHLGDGAGAFTFASNTSVGTSPQGGAVGDFNNDGKQDIAVANHGDGSVSILQASTPGTFFVISTVPVGLNPYSVAVGDFNNDGNQDFAAVNSGSGTVSIRLGDGLGSFTGTNNVTVGSFPTSVAVSDFNNDGKHDLVTSNNNSNTASIRLGDGAGNFSGTTNVSVTSSPLSVAVGDFNGDGNRDIAAVGSSSASIRLGDGSGSFSGITEVPIGSTPWSVAIGDFNGDGIQDLAATSYDSNTVSIRHGDGLGGFNGTSDLSVGSQPIEVAVGDINEDGIQDLVTANSGNTSPSVRLGTCVLPNEPPVAGDDNVTATEDTPLNFTAASLLANDTDPNNDPLLIALVSASSSQGGTVGLSGGNEIVTYTPPNNFTGTDTFTYIVTDGTLGDTGLVTVQVNSTIPPPTVNTAGPSNVTGTTATLNGLANPNGSAATGWFRYSLSDPGTCNDSFGTRTPSVGGTDLGAGSSVVPFSQGLTGLMPDATVYYCAIAQNSGGLTFGSVLSFTPQFAGPSATTNAATSVFSTSATLNGSVNPNGSPATGWFRYAAVNPGTCNDTFGTRGQTSTLGSGNSDFPFTQALTGLSPGTTYFFCVIGSNSGGTAFGSVLQFTTRAAPSVTTNTATSVSSSSATLNGQAAPNGSVTTAWFRYSTSNPVTCNDTFGTRAPTGSGGTSLGSGTSPVDFTRPITGLAAGTTYFYCAIAQNGEGQSFGAISTFSTATAAPSVTTSAATAVTFGGATLNGSAVANGDPTTGWFRYATSNPGTCNDTFGTRAPTAGGTTIGNSTNSVPFTQALTGLTPSTTYYVCAIAQNAIGTSFGSVMQFTTANLNAFLSVTPNNLGFGNQLVGTSSSPQGVEIRNEGTDPLVLGTLTFQNGTAFSFTQDPSGQTLAAGQSVTASIVFSPNSEALFDDVLSIPSNVSGVPTVALQGAGVNPDIVVNPTSLDFGTVSTAMGAARQVLVSNTGSADLVITGAVDGTNAPDFTTSLGNDLFILQPGTSTQIVVFFNPTGTGNRTAVFLIGSNDPDESVTQVNLTGNGINPGFLQFSAASYSGNEGDGTIAVTVQRVGGSQGDVSAFFSTSGGLATGGEACGGGIDYVNQIPFANFADGDAEPKTVLITVCDDAIVESTETFNIQLFADGADIGANTQAIVALGDNDVAGQISISGTIVNVGNSPLEAVNVALAGSSSGGMSTNISGAFTFADIPSGSYVVTPVNDPSILFDPISRSYPNRTTSVTDANFTAYAPGTQPRTLTVLNGFATPGQQALVPIMLQSQGNEAGLTFSLAYDQTLLSGATVECGSAAGAGCSLAVNTATPGKIGISVDPVAATFAAGNREVVRVLFFTSPTASVLNTPVTFANDPAISETSDGDANPLLTRYIGGSVIFIQGIESDVAPRPNGDGVVTSVDVAQVRRFAVGLDTFDPQNNEFQRADSSPYATAGDGIVAATDITQARRYQIGTDPTQPAGGPGSSSRFAPLFKAALPESSVLQAPRAVRVVNASASRGTQVTVAVETDAAGDENVYGFSMNYDTAILSNPVVTIGGDAIGGNVLANTTQPGMIGFSVDFGSSAMPAGFARELVTIRFDVSPTAPAGQTPLGFSDAPAFRETSSAGAQALETSYANGFVTILAPTAATASITGRVVTVHGASIRGALVTIQDATGTSRTFSTNTLGYYRFDDLQVGQAYVVSVTSRRYRFATPTQVVDLSDNVTGLNFVGSP